MSYGAGMLTVLSNRIGDVVLLIVIAWIILDAILRLFSRNNERQHICVSFHFFLFFLFFYIYIYIYIYIYRWYCVREKSFDCTRLLFGVLTFETQSQKVCRVQPTRCNVPQFIYFCKTLYMFQTVFPSIIRCSKLQIQRQVFVRLILLSASSRCSFELLIMDGKPV